MSDIDINAFTGMNNMSPSFSNKKGVVTPRVVLNADVDDSGEINIRKGLTLYLSLPGAHSLWSCESCMLCVSQGTLYDISTGGAVAIASISGPDGTTLDYAYVEGKVYISNQYWNGIYQPDSGSMSTWGIEIPDQPILLSTTGSLPQGKYHVVLTNLVNGELSGNSQISSIDLDEDSGIQIINRPSGSLVWATDQNGYIFTLVGDTDEIVNLPTVEPLPSFMCSPPPFFTSILYAFGRVWGADGDILYYSEPYQPGLFKPNSNYFKFNSEITLIAKVSSGLFVGMQDNTVFLAGVEPDQMTQLSAGAGSIRGTLAYCNNLPELGDILGTPEKGYTDVPVWRTTEGVVAGNVTGKLFNLTKHKVKMSAPSKGASLYRQKDGEFQFITSSPVGVVESGVGGIDPLLATVFQDGKISTSNLSKKIDSSVAGFSEEVSCEIWRNGVLIEG